MYLINILISLCIWDEDEESEEGKSGEESSDEESNSGTFSSDNSSRSVLITRLNKELPGIQS